MITVTEYVALHKELEGLRIAALKEGGCIQQHIVAVEADIASAELDPFDVLGVPYDASADTISAAYSAKLQEYQASLSIHSRDFGNFKGSKRDEDRERAVTANTGVMLATNMRCHLGYALQSLSASAA